MKKITLSLLMMTILSVVPTTQSPFIHQAQATVTDFSDLVERVSPSVVRVSIVKNLSEEARLQAQTAEILRQYFGANIATPDVPAVEYGYGTGFFISQDGYILTNHHVVEEADAITVTLQDRTELDAVLVGSDETADVAVLKVKGNKFPALPIAKGDKLRVGEPVLAIGSPFGFDYSASAGIVSAKSRNLGKEAAVPFIQSDVALNPGNSGGPLFNQKGEVVGVNSRIFSGTGGHMGLSFSIPIDTAMDIYEQIKATGKVTRVYLGIAVQDIDRNLAQVYQLTKPQGALLTRVLPNSPADRVGLKRGDVILSFNGTAITHASELLTMINRAKPEQGFNLTYRRGGQNYNVNGKFGETPKDSAEKQADDRLKFGLRLKNLTQADARRLGLLGGVIITSVEPMGLAAKAGLQSGDVMLELNHHPIYTVDDFVRAVNGLPKTGVVMMGIIRQGEPAIIGFRIDNH